MALLSVSHLAVDFHFPRYRIRAVDDVSFTIEPGEVLGLVGESGAGKTVTCRALIRLLPGRNARIASGRVDFAGRDIARLPEEDLRPYRGRQIAFMFQDSAAQFDPVMAVGTQIAETIAFHDNLGHDEARGRAIEWLRQVGLSDPQHQYDWFPHQFSGGLRQRVLIAMALAASPKLLIADEPTTGLDVTVQAQILRLLLDLRDKLGFAIILVTPDLGVVAEVCDAAAIMYAGRIVEQAPKSELLSRPLHPYSEALMRALPDKLAPGAPLLSIAGQAPSLAALPRGCRFHPRCPYVEEGCRFGDAQLAQVSPWRTSACLRWQILAQ
jgi:peptide/nickel transport system ATP-binding protein